MNRVVLVSRYDPASAFEEEDGWTDQDPEYGKIASEMPYREGTLEYELFREPRAREAAVPLRSSVGTSRSVGGTGAGPPSGG